MNTAAAAGAAAGSTAGATVDAAATGERAPFLLTTGSTPLVVSIPHAGTVIPPALAARMTPAALAVPDTDWHVPRLYAFARAAGAALIEARLSRYVIDLNRPPDDAPLYAGQVATGLCPTLAFDGSPLYRAAPPDGDEVATRRALWWQPWHAALDGLVEAARARHGWCIVLDAHSIRSEVPRLFAGRLPDLNLGTNDGRSCDAGLAQRAYDVLGGNARFTRVRDGRFKGGYITRSRGQPARGVHALQLEITWRSYMDEAGNAWDGARAAPLVALLGRLVPALLEWRP